MNALQRQADALPLLFLSTSGVRADASGRATAENLATDHGDAVRLAGAIDQALGQRLLSPGRAPALLATQQSARTPRAALPSAVAATDPARWSVAAGALVAAIDRFDTDRSRLQATR